MRPGQNLIWTLQLSGNIITHDSNMIVIFITKHQETIIIVDSQCKIERSGKIKISCNADQAVSIKPYGTQNPKYFSFYSNTTRESNETMLTN